MFILFFDSVQYQSVHLIILNQKSEFVLLSSNHLDKKTNKEIRMGRRIKEKERKK